MRWEESGESPTRNSKKTKSNMFATTHVQGTVRLPCDYYVLRSMSFHHGAGEISYLYRRVFSLSGRQARTSINVVMFDHPSWYYTNIRRQNIQAIDRDCFEEKATTSYALFFFLQYEPNVFENSNIGLLSRHVPTSSMGVLKSTTYLLVTAMAKLSDSPKTIDSTAMEDKDVIITGFRPHASATYPQK